MYAVVGETLGADEFEAKFFKGKVGLNNFVRKETQEFKKPLGLIPMIFELRSKIKKQKKSYKTICQ